MAFRIAWFRGEAGISALAERSSCRGIYLGKLLLLSIEMPNVLDRASSVTLRAA